MITDPVKLQELVTAVRMLVDTASRHIYSSDSTTSNALYAISLLLSELSERVIKLELFMVEVKKEYPQL